MVTFTLAFCPERETTHIITPDGDHLTIIYCPDGSHNMARSTDKTVLFCLGKDGSKATQWPVAVFNKPDEARSYATILRLAYRSGDLAAVKSLDPQARYKADGTLLADVKFSTLTLPYAPMPGMPDDDDVLAEHTSG